MKSLETYIHKAQQAKSAVPLLSHDELRSIVQQKLDGSVQTSSAVSHSSFNYKGLIMASLIGSLAVGALMWLQLGNPYNRSWMALCRLRLQCHILHLIIKV